MGASGDWIKNDAEYPQHDSNGNTTAMHPIKGLSDRLGSSIVCEKVSCNAKRRERERERERETERERERRRKKKIKRRVV